MKTAADYSLDEALERTFERKRANFVADYELEAKPALIWQCMPAESLAVDVAKEAVRTAFSGGAQAIANDSWWYGFNSERRVAWVFEGIASSSAEHAAGWVSQLHVDGHLIAGIWTFPELPKTSPMPGPALGAFYVAAFRDFAYSAGKVYEGADHAGKVFITCTMLQAHTLPLASDYNRIYSSPVKRQTLRWPVLVVDGIQGLSKAGEAMSTQFLRAYNMTPRRP